jgi:hypothetical protein
MPRFLPRAAASARRVSKPSQSIFLSAVPKSCAKSPLS